MHSCAVDNRACHTSHTVQQMTVSYSKLTMVARFANEDVLL